MPDSHLPAITCDAAIDYVETHFKAQGFAVAVSAASVESIDGQDVARVQFRFADNERGEMQVWHERSARGFYLYGEW